MKSSVRDKTEGAFHELKGTAKEIAGRLNADPDLEAAGTGEKIAGRAQEKLGQIKKILGK
ncbi:MAG: CsbD family protein [Desulfuromonadaceae bacterium]|nr:CsbD family protein [Desulfuromonadaceae bacterium]